jgi:hypothetical protein
MEGATCKRVIADLGAKVYHVEQTRQICAQKLFKLKN